MAKILLIGEFSNVHWTLAQGLRLLGHTVKVISDGDGWKNYSRDVNVDLSSVTSFLKLSKDIFLSDLYKGYDVVQFIHFLFMFPLSKNVLNSLAFSRLKKYNKSVFLGAFGDDYFWVNACLQNKFRYSPFDLNKDNESAHKKYALNFLETKAKQANIFMADKVDGIVAGLYEYYEAYKLDYIDKLKFIPFPINIQENEYLPNTLEKGGRLKFFLGIQKSRSSWKGTDKLERILRACAIKFPNTMQLEIVQNVPYSTYISLYRQTNIVVDQLYSYSPAMNALTAMSQGKVILGGGENEMYDLYGENINRPIYNLVDDEKFIIKQIENLLDSRFTIEELGFKNRMFIEEHHHYVDVAKRYLKFWSEKSH